MEHIKPNCEEKFIMNLIFKQAAVRVLIGFWCLSVWSSDMILCDLVMNSESPEKLE
jgi:hypothetical protein